ncbi:nitroreductase [Moraxella sp. ZY210820]|uniref:nitroreductase family protein n=1 Tax=unclassified Moraxella TaxID=2685852 RepID=UPI0027314DB2|nr:nitroreductase [Moraxella sp. ZY210820]WLF85025.1 nitroreductase [Moraxella sp. ZY210820]
MNAEIIHDLIEQRRSVGLLHDPAPSNEQLMMALQMAQYAPDHRCLQPTQFIIVEREQRKNFAQILIDSLRADKGEADEIQMERIQQQVMRAPMLVLAFTKIQQNEKVPAFEQLLSTGAAVQNVLLSLQAQGFATMWRTGEWVNSDYLKQYFGFNSEDYLSAIIYIGSATRAIPPRTVEPQVDFIRTLPQFPQPTAN